MPLEENDILVVAGTDNAIEKALKFLQIGV
jgi:K+/H+ antiporter YhaU regulatory subunit KhtT